MNSGKVEKGNSSEAGPSTVKTVKVSNSVLEKPKVERLDVCSKESIKKFTKEMKQNKTIPAVNVQGKIPTNVQKEKVKSDKKKKKKKG